MLSSILLRGSQASATPNTDHFLLKGYFTYLLFFFSPVKYAGYALLILLTSRPLSAQNLIPDPGFEQISARPGIWLNYKEQFNTQSPIWQAATANAPDIVSQNNTPTPFEKGTFGLQAPHNGEVMIGMQLAGERISNDFFRRDFLITPLLDTVQEGECYYFSLWITRRLDAGILSNNLGVVISDTMINQASYRNLKLPPVFNYRELLNIDPRKWLQIESYFKANQTGQHLIIGNFYGDEATQTMPTAQQLTSRKPIAYYYLDDLFLAPVHDSLCSSSFKETTKLLFTLPEIGFQTASYEISDSGRSLLQDLASTLIQQNDTLPHLRIIGHTDNIGNTAYNKILSLRRAHAVADILKASGISSEVSLEGKGDTMPVASNDTAEGRAKNRRVEILVEKN